MTTNTSIGVSQANITQKDKSSFNNQMKAQSDWHEDSIDVILIFLPKSEREFIQSIKVFRNSEGDIDLCDLLRSLKGMAFPIERNVISYYSYPNDMYIYCGNDPLPAGSTIPASEIFNAEEGKQVTVRVRQVLTNMPISAEAGESDNIKLEGSINFAGEGGAGAGKQKRTKERKIGEILDKVLQWRRFYTGVVDPTTGQTVKMSLEEAAQRVGISKKSLDDYLLQIRFGKKYGFNFNDHYNEKVGVLRTFVKKHKGKKGDKLDDGDDDLNDMDEGETKAEPNTLGKKPKKF